MARHSLIDLQPMETHLFSSMVEGIYWAEPDPVRRKKILQSLAGRIAARADRETPTQVFNDLSGFIKKLEDLGHTEVKDADD